MWWITEGLKENPKELITNQVVAWGQANILQPTVKTTSVVIAIKLNQVVAISPDTPNYWRIFQIWEKQK